MAAYFISGSGTGVGKTYLATRIIAAWRSRGIEVDALKPVASGFDAGAAADSDSGRILAALGRAASPGELDRVSPWRYAEPLSPDMAAARQGRTVPYGEVARYCRDAVEACAGGGVNLLIEGIGGVMVPLDARRTVLDLIAATAIPVILVAGSYVGTLSHTLTAVAALRSRRVAVDRVVVSETPGSAAPLGETCAVLGRLSPGTPVEALPRGAGFTSV